MSRWSRFLIQRRRVVLAVTLLALPIAAVAGAGVHDRLSAGGFVPPSASSTRATQTLERLFNAGPSNFILLVHVHGGTVGDPENTAAGRALTAQLAAEPGVADVLSYWNIPVDPPERSPLADFDEKQAIVAARLLGDEDAQRHTAEHLAPKYNHSDARFTVTTGGAAEVSRQAATEAERSLKRAELLAAPLTLAALLIVFGGVLAATLPLAVAALAVVGTFVALSGMAALADVSILSLNLTTALGLGLAIDYSLLLVSRYREELAANRSVESALARTLETAGRTVMFSAATVAASLAALLVFPIPYLRSFAYAGIAVVVLSCLAALVVLPAVLAVLGGRLRARRAGPASTGFWRYQARRVMRHAVLYVVGATALLLILGLPFLRVHLGRIDDRVLPAHLSSRQTDDAIRKDFDFQETTPIAIVLPHTAPNQTKALAHYVDAILKLDNVHRVDWAQASSMPYGSAAATSYHHRFVGNGATWLSVVPSLPYDSAGTKRLVDQLRALPAPAGDHPLVGGATAALTDTLHQVGARVPLAVAIVAVATFVLLFLMTGSVVMPVKALLLNALSLTATFGAIVWVFQEGHLAGVLDFTPTGSIDTFTPILMFCVAFGLSMDYEVFLLARIKEEWDLSSDNEQAVQRGLERTGRLVTAAALLMVIVFACIGLTSGVVLAKMFGLGLTLAVLVDAFIVRTLLIPAFMKLAGRINWWAPRRLRRLHLRYGVWETDPITLDRPFEEIVR